MNWGKWGADDEVGASTTSTPEVIWPPPAGPSGKDFTLQV